MFLRPRHNFTVRAAVALATFGAVLVTIFFTPIGLSYPAPLRVIRLAEIVDSLLLAALCYAALGLLIKRRASWIAAVCTLVGSAAWAAVQSGTLLPWTSVAIAAALVVVLATYAYYPHQSEPSGVWLALNRALKFTLFTTIGGCIGYFFLALIEHRPFNLINGILASLSHMYVLPDVFEPLVRPTAGRVIGRAILFLLGLTNYILIALALLRPIVHKFTLTHSVHQRARQLLERYATGSDDYFKYFPGDKSYYFSPGIEGFVAYGVSKGVCVALAGPVASSNAKRKTLLADFLEFANRNSWQVCVLSVQEIDLPLYRHFGLNPIKLGAHAIVDTRNFMEDTARNKHFRYIQNRFSKQGYTAELLTPPYSTSVMAELQAISQQWLSRDSRKERTFAMGYFEPSYIQSCDIFVVRRPDGRICAFVNLVPSFSKKRISFDLLRYGDDVMPDTSAFLFLRLITHLTTTQYSELDMGLAPLSGLDPSRSPDERGLHLLYTYANKYFAFKGLHKFKDRFMPVWEPRYAVFQGSRLRLVSMMVELNRLMKYTQENIRKDDTWR